MDRYLLEFDSERAGGLSLCASCPRQDGRVGLVTTKEPALESEDELLRRIEQASNYIPMENLASARNAVSPRPLQGNLITWDDMQRKLELVAKVARRVWG